MFNDSFTNFPILESERLTLRRLDEKDAKAMQEYLSDYNYMKYTDYPPNFTVNSDVIHAWKNDAYHAKAMLRWCIALKDTDLCIGTIYLFLPYGDDISGRRMDIGYEIARKYANKGYVTEAIKKVVEYGFTEMGLKRIQAQIIPENIASIRAVEKCGFVIEGTLRNSCHYQFSNELKTMVMMACIPSDFCIHE
ncbi:MAG: GNAT family N-acetyltransferase [Oscillospiraceae bacterium]|nr:GNAT family N-acetyltransferase [Oscillospiraceae bacterium]